MSAPLTPTDVFTPNDFPRHTYVSRSANPPFEGRLRNALAIPKEVISISGPSKSGKTVLIERVVDADNLITVSGSEIYSADALWDRVLDWMGAPSSRTNASSSATTSGRSGQIGGSLSLPFGAFTGKASASAQGGNTTTEGITSTQDRRGMAQVQEEIGDSSFCVLVDDFHYIATELQVEIGRQIKTAAERGIRIIVASVPHRSDDVVRSNSELRGRTQNIDIGFWDNCELLEIAKLGFRALNMHLSDAVLKELAENSCGSPQLMQRICLNLSVSLGVVAAYEATRYVADNEINLRNALLTTSTSCDYKTLLTTMHGGPKTRGMERNKYDFIDGSRGDVYRCILLAIRQDPPLMDLPYSVLMERVRSVCIEEAPMGRGVTEACGQISEFATKDRTVEFDTDADVETFHISDPYWLFYLRCSPKMEELAKDHHAGH